jgi:hypothetical protein
MIKEDYSNEGGSLREHVIGFLNSYREAPRQPADELEYGIEGRRGYSVDVETMRRVRPIDVDNIEEMPSRDEFKKDKKIEEELKGDGIAQKKGLNSTDCRSMSAGSQSDSDIDDVDEDEEEKKDEVDDKLVAVTVIIERLTPMSSVPMLPGEIKNIRVGVADATQIRQTHTQQMVSYSYGQKKVSTIVKT